MGRFIYELSILISERITKRCKGGSFGMLMTKILTGSWAGLGGATEVVRLLSQGIDAAGHEHDVFHYTLPKKGRPRMRYANGQVRVFPTIDALISSLASDYDVVHMHSTALNPTQLAQVQKRTNAPLVHTAHSIQAYVGLSKPVEPWVTLKAILESGNPRLIKEAQEFIERNTRAQTRMFSDADAIIVHSDWMRQTMGKFYPADVPAKTAVIPIATDFGKYFENQGVIAKAAALKRKFGPKPIALYVGRFSYEKGVDTVVKAYNCMRALYGLDAALVLVGDNKGGHEQLVTDNLDPRFRRDVHMEGRIDNKADVAAYFTAAANGAFGPLTMASYTESFGIAALEAMLIGTPVIISDVDAPHDLFVTPQYARGVEPGDVDGIARAMAEVVINPESERRKAERIRQKVTTQYSLEACVEGHLAVYDAVIGGAPFVSIPPAPPKTRPSRKTIKRPSTTPGVMPVRIPPGLSVNEAILALAPGAAKEREMKKGSNRIHFYQTPGFEVPGLVAKQAHNEMAAGALALEAAALATVTHMNEGEYRTPRLFLYDVGTNLMVQERVFGQDALEALQSGALSFRQFLADADEWLKAFQGPVAAPSHITVGRTALYAKTPSRYFAFKARRPNHNPKHAQAVKALKKYWKRYELNAPVALTTGDFSPIHLFYSTDGNKYGIDFNAAHQGTMGEEAGQFMGNAYFHARRIGLDLGMVRSEFGRAIQQGKFGGPSPLICFALGSSYYAKAQGAHYKDSKMEDRLLNAAIQCFSTYTFTPELLKF